VYRKIIGVIRLLAWYAHPSFQSKLRRLEQEMLSQFENIPRKRRCKILVGYSKVGKTTFAKMFTGEYAIVASDDILQRLGTMFRQLHDCKTTNDTRDWLCQYLTYILRSRLANQLFRDGRNVLSDSCNLGRNQRRRLVTAAKRAGYATEIVWVQCDPKIHRLRLERADAERQQNGFDPTSVALYENIQRPRFKPPELDHADALSVFKSQNIA